MRELEQTLDALTRETKFYYIIMDNFIQPEEYRKLENRAEFDDEREVWQFKPIAEGAGIKAMMKRPERLILQIWKKNQIELIIALPVTSDQYQDMQWSRRLRQRIQDINVKMYYNLN